jgi:signal peptidase
MTGTEPSDSIAGNNPSVKKSRVITIINNIFSAVIVLLIIIMVVFLVQYKVSGGQPKIAGYHMYIVLSGSMKPAFDARSLIFVKPVEAESIKEGDIITYRGSGDKQSLTTHRVVGIDASKPGALKFITKGDANEVNDPVPVPAENLVGRMVLAIPYVGVLMSFGQTKQGILILIIVPGVLLMISEIHKLYVNRGKNKEKKQG